MSTPVTPEVNESPAQTADAAMDAIVAANKKAPPAPVQETKPEPVAETKQEAPVVEKPKGFAEKVFAKAKPVEEAKPEATEVKAETGPEDAPEDKIVLDSNTGVRAREGFAELKSIAKQLRASEAKARAEANEIKARLEAQAKVAPIAADEVEKLKAEHKAALDRIALIDIKAHPSYQKDFEQPKKQLLAAANELVAAHGIEGANLDGLLDLPRAKLGAALEEITSKLPSLDARDVERHISDAYRIAQAEREALSKAGETAKELQRRQAERAVVEFGNTFKELAPKITEFSPEWDVDEKADETTKARAEKYNASLKGLRQRAEQYTFAASDEKAAASIGIKAATLDHVYEHLLPNLAIAVESKERENAQLRAELEAIRKHNPNKASFAVPSTNDGAPNFKEMTTDQVLDHYYRK